MGPFIIHKERFLAAGTHFFRAGGLRGPPQKIYIFLRVLKFSGALNSPLNEKNIRQKSFKDFTDPELDNMGLLNKLFEKKVAWKGP